MGGVTVHEVETKEATSFKRYVHKGVSWFAKRGPQVYVYQLGIKVFCCFQGADAVGRCMTSVFNPKICVFFLHACRRFEVDGSRKRNVVRNVFNAEKHVLNTLFVRVSFKLAGLDGNGLSFFRFEVRHCCANNT